MKIPASQTLKIVYEFTPSDPEEAALIRGELDRVFDALFELVLKSETKPSLDKNS